VIGDERTLRFVAADPTFEDDALDVAAGDAVRDQVPAAAAYAWSSTTDNVPAIRGGPNE
jgi:hypothetical protein